MIGLILAAGYGTRLSRDLQERTEEYPQLVGVPKPLLPVAGVPLITHWVRSLKACSQISCIAVVVSARVLCSGAIHIIE